MNPEQYAKVRRILANSTLKMGELSRGGTVASVVAGMTTAGTQLWGAEFSPDEIGKTEFLDLSGADLAGGVFALGFGGQFLRSANLSGANLEGSHWFLVSAFGTNFNNANLRGMVTVDLFCDDTTTFSGADLSGAMVSLHLVNPKGPLDFSNANLTGATLHFQGSARCNFAGAQVQGLKLEPWATTTTVAQHRQTVQEFTESLSPEQLAQVTIGEPKKSGCFIATACYGSYDAPEVRILRRFRDESLLPSRAGRLLVAAYYRVSPPIARVLERSPRLRALVRAGLVAPMVAVVSRAQREPVGSPAA